MENGILISFVYPVGNCRKSETLYSEDAEAVSFTYQRDGRTATIWLTLDEIINAPTSEASDE